MFRRTNEMHKFLQMIFIFTIFLLAVRVSDWTTCPSSGTLSVKLYHAVGTFVQACLAAARLYNHAATLNISETLD